MTAGLDAEGAMQATLGMGVVNVLMTLVSMVVVERAGRRTLLLAGMAGMALSTVVLTVTLAFKVGHNQRFPQVTPEEKP